MMRRMKVNFNLQEMIEMVVELVLMHKVMVMVTFD